MQKGSLTYGSVRDMAHPVLRAAKVAGRLNEDVKRYQPSVKEPPQCSSFLVRPHVRVQFHDDKQIQIASCSCFSAGRRAEKIECLWIARFDNARRHLLDETIIDGRKRCGSVVHAPDSIVLRCSRRTSYLPVPDQLQHADF